MGKAPSHAVNNPRPSAINVEDRCSPRRIACRSSYLDTPSLPTFCSLKKSIDLIGGEKLFPKGSLLARGKVREFAAAGSRWSLGTEFELSTVLVLNNFSAIMLTSLQNLCG